METIKIHGITYKIGDTLEYLDCDHMNKGDLCTLIEIKEDNYNIFFRVKKNDSGKRFGGLYAHRFRLYKENNLVNY